MMDKLAAYHEVILVAINNGYLVCFPEADAKPKASGFGTHTIRLHCSCTEGLINGISGLSLTYQLMSSQCFNVRHF